MAPSAPPSTACSASTEPKAPDKTPAPSACASAAACASPAAPSAAALAQQEQENKDLETLDDGQLRALLDEAITYKSPKDREGKSLLFKELLEEAEQDEVEETSGGGAGSSWRGGRDHRSGGRRNRRGERLPHSGSLQDLVAAALADVTDVAPQRRRHAPVSARTHHGGSLPSGVDRSFLMGEEPVRGCGGADYIATVRCVNPPPLTERRVSVSDAQNATEMELLNRRSKIPCIPVTYTSRASLEIGSGAVNSGRAHTTTTCSNQVCMPPRAPPITAPPVAPIIKKGVANASKCKKNKSKKTKDNHQVPPSDKKVKQSVVNQRQSSVKLPPPNIEERNTNCELAFWNPLRDLNSPFHVKKCKAEQIRQKSFLENLSKYDFGSICENYSCASPGKSTANLSDPLTYLQRDFSSMYQEHKGLSNDLKNKKISHVVDKTAKSPKSVFLKSIENAGKKSIESPKPIEGSNDPHYNITFETPQQNTFSQNMLFNEPKHDYAELYESHSSSNKTIANNVFHRQDTKDIPECQYLTHLHMHKTERDVVTSKFCNKNQSGFAEINYSNQCNKEYIRIGHRPKCKKKINDNNDVKLKNKAPAENNYAKSYSSYLFDQEHFTEGPAERLYSPQFRKSSYQDNNTGYCSKILSDNNTGEMKIISDSKFYLANLDSALTSQQDPPEYLFPLQLQKHRTNCKAMDYNTYYNENVQKYNTAKRDSNSIQFAFQKCVTKGPPERLFPPQLPKHKTNFKDIYDIAYYNENVHGFSKKLPMHLHSVPYHTDIASPFTGQKYVTSGSAEHLYPPQLPEHKNKFKPSYDVAFYNKTRPKFISKSTLLNNKLVNVENLDPPTCTLREDKGEICNFTEYNQSDIDDIQPRCTIRKSNWKDGEINWEYPKDSVENNHSLSWTYKTRLSHYFNASTTVKTGTKYTNNLKPKTHISKSNENINKMYDSSEAIDISTSTENVNKIGDSQNASYLHIKTISGLRDVTAIHTDIQENVKQMNYLPDTTNISLKLNIKNINKIDDLPDTTGVSTSIKIVYKIDDFPNTIVVPTSTEIVNKNGDLLDATNVHKSSENIKKNNSLGDATDIPTNTENIKQMIAATDISINIENENEMDDLRKTPYVPISTDNVNKIVVVDFPNTTDVNTSSKDISNIKRIEDIENVNKNDDLSNTIDVPRNTDHLSKIGDLPDASDNDINSKNINKFNSLREATVIFASNYIINKISHLPEASRYIDNVSNINESPEAVYVLRMIENKNVIDILSETSNNTKSADISNRASLYPELTENRNQFDEASSNVALEFVSSINSSSNIMEESQTLNITDTKEHVSIPNDILQIFTSATECGKSFKSHCEKNEANLQCIEGIGNKTVLSINASGPEENSPAFRNMCSLVDKVANVLETYENVESVLLNAPKNEQNKNISRHLGDLQNNEALAECEISKLNEHRIDENLDEIKHISNLCYISDIENATEVVGGAQDLNKIVQMDMVSSSRYNFPKQRIIPIRCPNVNNFINSSKQSDVARSFRVVNIPTICPISDETGCKDTSYQDVDCALSQLDISSSTTVANLDGLKNIQLLDKNPTQALTIQQPMSSLSSETSFYIFKTTEQVDASIPFGCITTPAVVTSCSTTSSAPVPSASVTATAALDTKRTVFQYRSAFANGLATFRGSYSITGTTSVADEFKKSLDENGNALTFNSPLSGSSQHKKPRRKKSSKNETVAMAEQIDGHQGNKDVNELLRFIENADNGRHNKHQIGRIKHNHDDDKNNKKRSTERRIKDKTDKIKRANSMEELSLTKLEDLTHEKGKMEGPMLRKNKKERISDGGAPTESRKSERRSWGDESRDTYYHSNSEEPHQQTPPVTSVREKKKKQNKSAESLSHEVHTDPPVEAVEFQTVTKKKRTRKRHSPQDEGRDGGARGGGDHSDILYRKIRTPNSPDRRRKSAPPSDKSNDSNDDLDSVHSLPAESTTERCSVRPASASSGGTPQASYADIARTRHNIPDLIESCNYYTDLEPATEIEEKLYKKKEPISRSDSAPSETRKSVAKAAEAESGPAYDAENYPALETRGHKTLPRMKEKTTPSAPPTAPLKHNERRPTKPHMETVQAIEERVTKMSMKPTEVIEHNSLPIAAMPIVALSEPPDVVLAPDRRPPVILLDEVTRPREMDGITFGFDINEQLLNGEHRDASTLSEQVTIAYQSSEEFPAINEKRSRARGCDLVRDTMTGGVLVRVGCAPPLRYLPPVAVPERRTGELEKIVNYIGSAWLDIIKCPGGKARYFSD